MASKPAKSTRARQGPLDKRLKQAQIRKADAEAIYWERQADKVGKELEDEDLSDAANRTVILYDDVDEDSVKECIGELNYVSKKYPKKPITLIVNSPGGYCVDGLALYDFLLELRSRGHKVITVASGHVASMGGIILQGGSQRLMQPNSYLLIHEVSAGAIGKTSHAQIKRKADRRDWILWSEEAVSAGFADAVSA